MQYIFFGGTFDPVHNGHLAIAKCALERFSSSTVIFAPSYVPPHKNHGSILPFFHRYNMAEAAVKEIHGIQLSRIEEEREGKSYTFDTLHILQERMPEGKIRLLIGSDSLLQLHTWYRAKELFRDFSIIVYPRSREKITKEVLADFWTEEEKEKLLSLSLENVPVFPVSSTQIRELYHKGKREEAELYLPSGAAEYIRKNFLYL